MKNQIVSNYTKNYSAEAVTNFLVNPPTERSRLIFNNFVLVSAEHQPFFHDFLDEAKLCADPVDCAKLIKKLNLFLEDRARKYMTVNNLSRN